VILRRLLSFLAAATALSVSAGVIVVALAYAVFALVRPFWGPAGAAAVVAGFAALLIGVLGLVMANLAKGKPQRRRTAPEPESLIDAVVDFVRSKPVTAVAGGLAAALMSVRKPGYLGSLLRAFVEGREQPPKRGKR
jgi:hypothetical protein